MWKVIAKIVAPLSDMNRKAIILQKMISEFGPVPDELGDLVRNAIKQNSPTDTK